MGSLRRYPWVVMGYLGITAGFWAALWTGLEELWVPFGFAAVAFAAGLASVLSWLGRVGGPPRLSDYRELPGIFRALFLELWRAGR